MNNTSVHKCGDLRDYVPLSMDLSGYMILLAENGDGELKLLGKHFSGFQFNSIQ
jgi:hypothetical protein